MMAISAGRIRRAAGVMTAAVFALLFVGCGGPMTRDLDTPALLWPAPPAMPRFELEPPLIALEIPTGFFGKIGRAIVGSPRGLAFDRPTGLCFTPDHDLAFVDQGANRVYVCDLQGKLLRELDLGRAGIEEAVDVAVALDGSLFVSDPRRGRVVRFPADPDDKTTTEIVTGGRPTSVVVDGGRQQLVVVDTTTPRILAIDLATLAVGERAPAVAGRAALNRPVWVTTSAAGGVWVVDALNFRVCHLSGAAENRASDDRPGEWTGCFGQLGDGPGAFSRPRGVAEDAAGRVYVVDALFGNCQVFDPDGRLLLAIGSRGSGPGELLLPSDIAIDGDLIAISDSYNRRIQLIRRLPPPAGETREESIP